MRIAWRGRAGRRWNHQRRCTLVSPSSGGAVHMGFLRKPLPLRSTCACTPFTSSGMRRASPLSRSYSNAATRNVKPPPPLPPPPPPPPLPPLPLPLQLLPLQMRRQMRRRCVRMALGGGTARGLRLAAHRFRTGTLGGAGRVLLPSPGRATLDYQDCQRARRCPPCQACHRFRWRCLYRCQRRGAICSGPRLSARAQP